MNCDVIHILWSLDSDFDGALSRDSWIKVEEVSKR